MVSPRKLEQAKRRNEVIKSSKPLEKYVFYLDIKNNSTCKDIEDKIKKFGGHVEVFLTEGVTHIVSDAPCGPGAPSPRTPQTPSSTATPHQWVRGRRTDAMLERAACLHHNSPRLPPQHNLPVWSLLKIKQFLSRIGSLAYKKVLKEPFIKFEAVDRDTPPPLPNASKGTMKKKRKSRAVYKELGAWPELHLSGEHSGCPFSPPERNKQLGNNTKPKVKVPTSLTRRRMTKKTKGRIKEQVEVLQKQSGYCEICRVDYSHLPDHERSPSHTAFVKNCSNFLSLDSLINSGADVEAFLKMNSTITSNHSIERRSLRNIIKVHQEDNSDSKKHLEVFCNGGSPRRQTTPQMSPALSDSKHYLRSKGSEKKDCRNGSLSPLVNYEKVDVGKLNGKVEELERCSPVPSSKGKRARLNMKWRRTTSPEVTEGNGESAHSYYKVVGMSTKLRSSASFTPAPPPPTNSVSACNGTTNPGLVVKFKRVRKSELSVLSDEAENFMFPKKDDSDTDEERESSHTSNRETSSDIKTESIIKEEEDSQDSYGSESTRRNPRRRTHVESYRDSIDYYGLEYPPAPRVKRKASSVPAEEKEVVTLTTLQKCLKWENGHLRASEQVENLTYAFEQIPNSEPWYSSFSRQDQGKEVTKSALPYLTCYRKPPVLPYEMAELPPLKPNCCILSQMKKPEPRPARLYGTRGMKKKKVKVDPIFSLSLNPRKSPREHASTLAILGGLIHRKRSKLSGSEDSKSLPSIAEEETSSDAPSIPLLNPVFEASRQLHQLLSTVFQDDAEEIPVDSMEGIDIERSKTNDVLHLIDSYEECVQLDNAVQEVCDSAQPGRPKPRKGHKFKKKNKTGWPNKKKVCKKDSRCSSGDRGAGTQGTSNISRLDENSITSISEFDDNASTSDKVLDNMDDNAVSSSEWQSSSAVDLQPVVRVLKMEESTARRLRSAAALNNNTLRDKRKLRRRRRPNR